MTNKPTGTLYIGVTNNLVRRIYEHRQGLIDEFTKTYNLKKLVYFEIHEQIEIAIQREKNLKHWKRSWKLKLIEDFNPDWTDLWETICN